MIEAIRREVKEEIGLELTMAELLEEVIDTMSVPGETWRVHYFMGQGVGELRLKLDEILEVVWVGAGDLESLDIILGHKQMLDKFFEGRKNARIA